MRDGSKWRTAAAILAGYLASSVGIALVFAGGWQALSTELLFHPDTTLVTSAWMMLAVIAGLLGASVGGLVAARIRPHRVAVWGLAGLILLVGWIMAVAHGFVDDPTGTEALGGRNAMALSAFEASSEAVAPVWFHVLLAVVQSGSALLAGRLNLARTRSED